LSQYAAQLPKYAAHLPKYAAHLPKYAAHLPKRTTQILNPARKIFQRNIFLYAAGAKNVSHLHCGVSSKSCLTFVDIPLKKFRLRHNQLSTLNY
jgi:hypothetical protein